MPFRKKPKEELVNAAMHPSATRKFLRKFHEYGRGKGWFPELPKDIREEELGRWMRKNTTLSDKELVEKMREWVHNYGIPGLWKELFSRHSGLPFPRRKTLSGFLQTHHGDCIAMSTTLGEMAKEMGFDVKYYAVDKKDIDKSRLTEEEKQVVESRKSNHAYVTIEGEQHDPAFNLSYTNHKGKPQTREERAADIWTNHGALLDEMEQPEKALTAHDIALELNPNHAGAWNNRGKALANLGKYKEAIKHYDKALKIDPNLAEAWKNKGDVLSIMGRYEEAIEHFDKALERNPKYAEAWSDKGSALANLGKYEEAIKHFDKALELNPNLMTAWLGKEFALAALGKL